jgi:hypothetical protein
MKMNTPIGTSLHNTNEPAEIEAFIQAGAKRLFGQFEKSNGYTSLGDSQLAEAAIVMHVSPSAAQRGHAVWPESPFRDRPDEGRSISTY